LADRFNVGRSTISDIKSGKNWKHLIDRMSVYEFGRKLLETNDLDPVYVILWEAALPEDTLKRWLLAYWCYYHMGTASWIAYQKDFWGAMETATHSQFPRGRERRHYRGENARKSVLYLREQGVSGLWLPLLEPREYSLREVSEVVRKWVGFGPWIAFKVADMTERLGLIRVKFDVASAMYEGSPTEGALRLWEAHNPGLDPRREPGGTSAWAVGQVLGELGELKAPPRYERPINVQEVETTLCKWSSYMKGHYRIGEDIDACHNGLLRFFKSGVSQRLLRAYRVAFKE
jgi:hypothetical protein